MVLPCTVRLTCWYHTHLREHLGQLSIVCLWFLTPDTDSEVTELFVLLVLDCGIICPSKRLILLLSLNLVLRHIFIPFCLTTIVYFYCKCFGFCAILLLLFYSSLVNLVFYQCYKYAINKMEWNPPPPPEKKHSIQLHQPLSSPPNK